MNRASLLFLGRFFAIVVVLYLVVAVNVVNERFVVPFTQGIASVSAATLRLIGEKTTAVETVIRSDHFAVNVENGCNGIEAMILLVAAIAAYPASWKARAAGLVLGIIGIQALNLFRVSSLFWLGRHYPKVFDMFHTAVWQSLIILAALAMFVVWSLRVGPAARTENAR